MTQIRRVKQSSNTHNTMTLLRVGVAVFGTFLLVLCFLQMDTLPSKHNHARMIKPPGLTPNVIGDTLSKSITSNKRNLVEQKQQGQQQQNLRRATADQAERRPIPNGAAEVTESGKEPGISSDKNTSPEDSASSSGEEQASAGGSVGGGAALESRRFVMELENLKPDESGSTSGKVIFETKPEWAPIGVQHFHALVEDHFYDQCRFFRVVDNFVVQFGIAADPAIQKKWKGDVLKDDPVATTNAAGTLTYATSGKNTRTTQLFINTAKRGNKFLDGQGFSPFALISSGMEHVYRINNEYGERPGQGKIQNQGNAYLEHDFPNLSFVNVIRPATPQD